MRRLSYIATMFTAAIVLMLTTALTAWAAESMTLTFIRHAESEANAAGVIDTSVPGPHITALGQQQADAIAGVLAPNDYDGIYASSMIRTQETAQPLADLLSQPIVVLPGLREIDAGVFEGESEDSGLGRIGYVVAPAAWTLGARAVPVLGSTDGNDFDARVDEAIQVIYDSGDRNAAVFSHGATIMFWTMMNVDNPDLGLILSHQLDNTDVVVITGNPEDGWTLENWAGVEVSAEPSLFTKLFVDVRDLVVAPQTALYRIQQAFTAGDIAGLAEAVQDGVVDVATQVVGFVPNVIGDVVGSAGGAVQSDGETPSESTDIGAARTTRGLLRSVPDDEHAIKKSDDATPSVAATAENSTATDLTDGNKFQPGDDAAAAEDASAAAGDGAEGSVTPDDVKPDATTADTGQDADADTADDAGGNDSAGESPNAA